MAKKKCDVELVLSDIHLGTYGCHAEELLIVALLLRSYKRTFRICGMAEGLHT